MDRAVAVVAEQARDTGCLAPATAALLEAVLVDELWEDVLDRCATPCRPRCAPTGCGPDLAPLGHPRAPPVRGVHQQVSVCRCRGLA
ncbi:MAG: hypothetical protein WKG07_29005 [Hymenobacter sp.]